MWSQKTWEEFDSLYCHIPAVWSGAGWLVFQASSYCFSILKGPARKVNVRSLEAYVISSLRRVFRALFPLHSPVTCMLSVSSPTKCAYMKSSSRNPWDVVFYARLGPGLEVDFICWALPLLLTLLSPDWPLSDYSRLWIHLFDWVCI